MADTDSSTKQTPQAIPPKRKNRMTALGASLAGLTTRAFGRRGFAQGAVVRDWAVIAGPLIADNSVPERILYPRGAKAGGTLCLRVGNPGLALELQHLEPMVIERINGYFGYNAVEKISIVQALLPVPPERGKSRPPLGPAGENALKADIAAVDDPDLRAALERLGRAIRTRPSRKTGNTDS